MSVIDDIILLKAKLQDSTMDGLEGNDFIDVLDDIVDQDGKIPADVLPSYVDDVIEGYYYNSAFYKDADHTQEIEGESGKIYVDLATGYSYRWSGSLFVQINNTDLSVLGVKAHEYGTDETPKVQDLINDLGIDTSNGKPAFINVGFSFSQYGTQYRRLSGIIQIKNAGGYQLQYWGTNGFYSSGSFDITTTLKDFYNSLKSYAFNTPDLVVSTTTLNDVLNGGTYNDKLVNFYGSGSVLSTVFIRSRLVAQNTYDLYVLDVYSGKHYYAHLVSPDTSVNFYSTYINNTYLDKELMPTTVALDNAKTYVLKCVNGTIQWVEETP